MGRPKSVRPTAQFKLKLDAELIKEIDEEIARIDIRADLLPGGRSPYGARRNIVEPLLRKWLYERRQARGVCIFCAKGDPSGCDRDKDICPLKGQMIPIQEIPVS